MVKIEIVDSTPKHTRELGKTLREEDKKEAERLGLDPAKAVFYAYRQASYRKTALIDNKVAAVWGVAGTPLGFTGRPYLITGTEVDKISPIKFARIYLEEVKKMRKLFPILENYVDASYLGAVRMLRIAGFKFNRTLSLGENKFYIFTMESD